MTATTHVLDLSGDLSISFGGGPNYGYTITRPIRALDGQANTYVALSRQVRAAPREDLSNEELDETLSSYLMAGGSAQAMTVEIRRKEGEEYVQYAIGRDEPTDRDEWVWITVGDNGANVHPNEVFDADEAIELFDFYYQHTTVPDSYTLRKLDLEVNEEER